MNGDHVQYIDREEANRRLRESVVQSYDTRKRTLDYTLTISWQRVAGYDYTGPGPQPGAFKLYWNAVHLLRLWHTLQMLRSGCPGLLLVFNKTLLGTWCARFVYFQNHYDDLAFARIGSSPGRAIFALPTSR
jgi:hypothetical protein